MNWKDIYDKVVENVCKMDYHEFDDIIEQGEPEFSDKLIVDDNHGENDLYSGRLDETVADEKDYKDFCEYVLSYIGEDINDYIGRGDKKFSSFKNPA